MDPHALLLQGISQHDVDFVIPRVGVDVPLGIDPFLLYKSRDAEYRQLHAVLIAAFNNGIEAVRNGATARARTLFDFPEVAAIGFGYTQGGKRGSGVGSHMTTLILETLQGSPGLQERGVRHIEEMQLLSAGIGPDRVSDIAANLLKRFLIDYTQRQCEIWNLERKTSVPMGHIYDPDAGDWVDSYEDLPVSPVDGSPILLVPRRIVRVLPWINYDDFVKTEFNAYLAARRAKARSVRSTASGPDESQSKQTKREVVTVTRNDIALVERYVRSREQRGREATPALNYIDRAAREEADELIRKLESIPAGRERAADYQRLVLEILNFLFSPELIDGQPEVPTFDGTERRDIIFTNDSDESFWEYIRVEHAGILVMFEVKNTDVLDPSAINQTATYLGDRLGRFGVIVTRASPPESIQRKAFSIWNDSAPNRKIILILSDANIRELIELRGRDGSPTLWLQRHYRAFRTAVQ
jgi:hypothetical protein